MLFITWWGHQIETFLHYWRLWIPHECQWCRALMFSLICAWINNLVNNREAGDLRRHRTHYAVIVMTCQVSGISYNNLSCKPLVMILRLTTISIWEFQTQNLKSRVHYLMELCIILFSCHNNILQLYCTYIIWKKFLGPVRETNAHTLTICAFWAGRVENWPGCVEFCIEHIRDECSSFGVSAPEI